MNATVKGLDDDLRAAWQTLLGLMREGVPPRDAVQQVIASFAGEFEELMTVAFSGIIASSVGSSALVEVQVQAIQLSRRMYDRAQETSLAVQNIVENHARGFQDARRLMLEIFEGYGFNESEPLNMRPGNRALPRYLREALLTDSDIAGQMQRLFARAQAEALKTPALRAAYLELLDALERGAGQRFLEKRLEVAWNEKMRYFARRIAETELHRIYSEQRIGEILGDGDVEFVQVRRAGTSDWACICDLITGRDKYGLGRGVYPKRLVPLPPFHPMCRCVLSPRLDFPLGTRWKENPDADTYFLRNVGLSMSARIMGSKAKAERALRGEDPIAITNQGKPSGYGINTPRA